MFFSVFALCSFAFDQADVFRGGIGIFPGTLFADFQAIFSAPAMSRAWLCSMLRRQTEIIFLCVFYITRCSWSWRFQGCSGVATEERGQLIPPEEMDPKILK